jgi:hypothetical protein
MSDAKHCVPTSRNNFTFVKITQLSTALINNPMKKITLLLFYLLPFALFAQKFNKVEIARWEKQAQQVQIIRDNWGFHIFMAKPMQMRFLVCSMRNARTISSELK